MKNCIEKFLMLFQSQIEERQHDKTVRPKNSKNEITIKTQNTVQKQ